MLHWVGSRLMDLHLDEIGEHYGRYRLHVPEAERAMAQSLDHYGQISPVVVCRREGRYELINDITFKIIGHRLVNPVWHTLRVWTSWRDFRWRPGRAW